LYIYAKQGGWRYLQKGDGSKADYSPEEWRQTRGLQVVQATRKRHKNNKGQKRKQWIEAVRQFWERQNAGLPAPVTPGPPIDWANLPVPDMEVVSDEEEAAVPAEIPPILIQAWAARRELAAKAAEDRAAQASAALGGGDAHAPPVGGVAAHAAVGGVAAHAAVGGVAAHASPVGGGAASTVAGNGDGSAASTVAGNGPAMEAASSAAASNMPAGFPLRPPGLPGFGTGAAASPVTRKRPAAASPRS